MQKVYKYGDQIWAWYPNPYSAASFDPGNIAFGVGYIMFDQYQFVGLPQASLVLALGKTWLEKFELAEALVRVYNLALDRAVQIYADVWNLMPDREWRDVDMDLTARNLKSRLYDFDKRFMPYTEVPYEFQMNKNDKSRTVSQFIRYHYAGICPVVKIGGGLKNTICFTPELDHRLYLQRYNDPYKANKQHAADSFRYLANAWNYDISHIPDDVMKDAGDAVMQLWARFRDEGKIVPIKPKIKPKSKRKPRTILDI
jgi:hypothetical protein